MNLAQIGTNDFLPQPVRLVASESSGLPACTGIRNWRDAIKAQSSELFPSFTRRSFPSGIRDGGRREPREARPCSLGRRNVYRDLAPAGRPPQVQESLVRGSNGGVCCAIIAPSFEV